MAYSTTILAESSLVGYWRLDDTTGTTAVDSKGTNPGTYSGGFTLGVTGLTSGSGAHPLGTAVTFNGSTGFITVPNATVLQLTPPYTLESWIKTSSSSQEIILAKYPTTPFAGYGLSVNSIAGKLGMWVGDNSLGWLYSIQNVNDGLWHHVVGTISGTTVSLYIDGVLDSTGTRTPSSVNSVSLRIATDPSSAGTSSFNGSLDEVAVYNTALSATAIANHYGSIGDGSQKARVSQFQALVIDVGTPTGRVSQFQTIVVGKGTPTARIAQTGVLFVGQGAPAARFSQAGVLFVGVGTPASRYSQIGMLAAYVGTPKVRTSQVGMLVAYRSISTPVTQAAILTCM